MCDKWNFEKIYNEPTLCITMSAFVDICGFLCTAHRTCYFVMSSFNLESLKLDEKSFGIVK